MKPVSQSGRSNILTLLILHIYVSCLYHYILSGFFDIYIFSNISERKEELGALAEVIICAVSLLTGNLLKSNLMISLANSFSGLINRLIDIFHSLSN